MRVLVISQTFPNASDPIRGIFVLEQVKATRRLGVEAVVCAPVPWVPSFLKRMARGSKFAAIPYRSNVDGITVEHPRVLMLPQSLLFFLYGWIHYLQCRGLIRHLTTESQFDLIHAHMVTPSGVTAVLLGRQIGIPVVCTLHGGDIHDYPYRNWAIRLATVWALKRVDTLVAVSHELRTRVASLVKKKDVSVVYNGADPVTFTPVTKLEARDRLNLPKNNTIILFVGYLVKEKGLEYLLDAFARIDHPGRVLYLVGDGPLRQVLERHDACSSRHVQFVGRRPHEEISIWLSAADCLVLPSISEGLPTIIPEAMISGVPVVATAIGGIPEIVRHRVTGVLVPCRDSLALAQAIEQIITDAELAHDLAERAKQFATAELTWERNAQQMVGIYQDVNRTAQSWHTHHIVKSAI